jgi:hypothetical protein
LKRGTEKGGDFVKQVVVEDTRRKWKSNRSRKGDVAGNGEVRDGREGKGNRGKCEGRGVRGRKSSGQLKGLL